MSDMMYVCIDLKSFYASVECVERGIDPLTTNLVVADPTRTEKTICLAITPAMKALGIKNRCRVFEIPPNVEYITAPPRMQLYLEYAANIYGIYLKYIAKEDIHVYSVDEAFLDVSDYLSLYQMSAKELGVTIMKDIYENTGITATCGVGTNMYLCKIALDITAKHSPDHIGELDEEKYRQTLWDHQPLTDFWRIGRGTVNRLAHSGMHTMRDIANAEEDLLYKLFGIDAELLIDHAWGRETTTMADIKNYHAKNTSISSGQVLPRDYEHEEGKLIVKEMTDLLCLDLVDKELLTKSVTLYIGYSNYLHMDSVRGSFSLDSPTSSSKILVNEMEKLYDSIKNPLLCIRRVNISFNALTDSAFLQYDLFTNPEENEKETKAQKAMIEIKKKLGKNAILKGMNFSEGGTTIERNSQIGGHKSGI